LQLYFVIQHFFAFGLNMYTQWTQNVRQGNCKKAAAEWDL